MLKRIKKTVISSLTAITLMLTNVLSATPFTAIAEEEPTDVLYRQNFELYPNEDKPQKVITLSGLMPDGAVAEAVDVSEEGSDTSAYDITITNGDTEYQPGAKNPIYVEIVDPKISEGKSIELWHVKDDGEREEITNFFILDDKISFYATGFSIYEVVIDPNVTPIDDSNSGWQKAVDPDDVEALVNENTEFYISQINGYYMTNTQYNVNSSRTGILKGAKCNSVDEALALTENKPAIYHFVPSNGKYKIYCYSTTGIQQYIKQSSNSLSFETDPALATEFTVAKYKNNSKQFVIYSTVGNDDFCINMQGGTGGKGFAAYNNNSHEDANNAITLWHYNAIADNPYKLNNKSYGLVNYLGGTVGNALMADETNNAQIYQLVSRDHENASLVKVLYISDEANITEWTFKTDGENRYKLYDPVSSKYLKANISSLVLVDDEDDATGFKVIPNTNGSISLMANNRYLFFDGSNFEMSNTVSTLNFVSKATLSSNDNITYTANRISVSDGLNAYNGQEVIVYTRIWDDINKKYDFYAIDHDGSLKQCFASGDKLMWLDDAMNTLLWKFTVYTANGKENGYYELQNKYSQKFIAPQLNGQILSNKKIGIQMPGRKYEVTGEPGNEVYNYGEYYSSIIAWDLSYYDYAALCGKADQTQQTIYSDVYAKADSFYFAILDSVMVNESSDTLHEVETVNNEDYGINMKVINFAQITATAGSAGSEITRDYFGGNVDNTKGLLSNHLDNDGHPIVAKTTGAGKDFGDAFNNARTANHLFINSVHESSGYFEYDSCQNFATLRGGKNSSGEYNGTYKTYTDDDGQTAYNFTVFRELGTNNQDKSTTKHGQFLPYNYIKPGVYSTVNPQNLYSVHADYHDPLVGLLSDDDPRKYEKLYTVVHSGESPDYYLGIEMDAKFVQTPSGLDAWGHDVVFEFTGDDDFWLYVDGELVLDLGGIHSAEAGKVNFRTGQVVAQGNSKTLRQIFSENYMARNPSATTAQLNEYLDKYFEQGEDIFKDYTEHTMKIYYMERGAGASNLHMRFNLSAVTPGNVLFAKTISGNDNDLADIDYSILQYPFQIQYKYTDSETETWKTLSNINEDHKVSVTYQNSTQSVKYADSYTPPNGTQSYEKVFFLIPNRRIEISFPDDAMYYRIIECSVNTAIYDDVSVNGKDENVTATVVSGNIKDLISKAAQVSEQPTITFNNHVKEGNIRTLNITKHLYNNADKAAAHELFYQNNDSSKVDKTTFSIRLYLSNGVDDNLVLADLCRYYIVDANGYLCKWNASEQSFTSTTTLADNVSTLSEAEKQQITFHSSRFGSISNIPANYTVKIPGLPAGTKFKIEERDYEIPVGYDLIDFDCQIGSDNVASYYPTEIHNPDGTATVDYSTGTIRAGFDAGVLVNNQKGFGLKAEKVWSDSSFTQEHDTIFTAVYIGDTLLNDSVKKITKSDNSVTYFFPSLASGKQLSDYKIYEVEVTPVYNGVGDIISYNVIRRLNEHDTTSIGVIDNGQTEMQNEDYTVSYSAAQDDEAAELTEQGNARKNIITNIRKGGIIINLNEWNQTGAADVPLADGVFTLKCNGVTVGEYTSDSAGKITMLYGFRDGDVYSLTETQAPAGYIGIQEPIGFTVIESNGVYSISSWINHNDTDNDETIDDGKYWAEYEKNNGLMIAEINIYNKPYAFEAIKIDADTTDTLDGARFSLHRTITGIGGLQKDINPIEGYENLRTVSGVIEKVDSTLAPGTYYLTEKSAPEGYIKLEKDIVFTVSPLGGITLNSADEGIESKTVGDTIVFTIPNTPDIHNYYFDIEKIIFVDKSVHDNDKEQKFVFKIERFDENETSLTADKVKEVFYTTINCTSEMTYISDDDIKISNEKYPYSFYHQDDIISETQSYFSYDNTNGVQIDKTYHRNTEHYVYSAAIWNGRQTICVKEKGIYRISEVSDWSSTDYDYWIKSNRYKGNGTAIQQGLDTGYVIFSVSAVNADKYEHLSYNDNGNITYRPTASFTSSESEYAYLSSQAYAENSLR